MSNIMSNIPTELLRTLIAVVDLRSFTRAAQSLGVTQPAVSAQIKRLQALLGAELFDKSAPGVMLTEKGEVVVSYARRLLSINDQILDLAAPRSSSHPLRIGLPGDLGSALLPAVLAEFRRRSPHQRFQVRDDGSEHLLRDLRQGELDLAVALAESNSTPDARHQWAEKTVWIRGPLPTGDPAGPVPLVLHHEGCVLNRLAMQTLAQGGRECDVVFCARSAVSVAAAVGAGLGITAALSRFVPADLVVWSDAPLPPLPDITCGIYLRDGRDRHLLELLADAIAEVMRPPVEDRISEGRSQISR